MFLFLLQNTVELYFCATVRWNKQLLNNKSTFICINIFLFAIYISTVIKIIHITSPFKVYIAR